VFAPDAIAGAFTHSFVAMLLHPLSIQYGSCALSFDAMILKSPQSLFIFPADTSACVFSVMFIW